MPVAYACFNVKLFGTGLGDLEALRRKIDSTIRDHVHPNHDADVDLVESAAENDARVAAPTAT